MSSHPSVHCSSLSTTFVGVQHPVSSPECPIQQFRGIKYATVPGRFRQSILNNSYPAVTDAKTHGPIAPQIKRNNLDDPLFGFIREEPFPVVQDEFECLNLVVTRPGSISADASLPVMVWIHGGSNVIGSGSHYLCDPGRLVRTSVEVDQPVIVVSINYRLGLFGFAASEALEESNRLLGDVGVGNYGLNDQLNALAWIRRHISSFGGNPSNLTLFGESAGAIDIHALLLSHTHQSKPIASRAILQSGVVRPPAVQSIRDQGAVLTRVMSRLRLNTIDDLRKCSVDELVLNTPATMHPTDDGVFFRPSWRSNPTPTNISSLIIGDCAYESVLWTPSVLLWSSISLIRRIRAVIRGMYKADTFLRTYGLTWSTDDEEAQQAAFNILNDTHFAWPTDRMARATKERGEVEVFRYVFDQESPFTFMAHHAVDLLYLFDNISPKGPVRKIPTFDSSGSDTSNESDYDSEGGVSPDSFDAMELAERENYFQISDFSYNAKRVTQSLQEKWIAFANGSKPWRPETLFVFGPEGEVGERPLEDELAVRRRVEQWDVALEGVDQEVVYRLGVELGNGPGHRAR